MKRGRKREEKQKKGGKDRDKTTELFVSPSFTKDVTESYQ